MVKLYKITGAGNNFLLIDIRKNSKARKLSKSKKARIARELCDPHQSIGADGLLYLGTSKIADVRWDFYNADGSSAEMCGNAARCVGVYMLDEIRERIKASGADLKKSNNLWLGFTLETKAGVVGIDVPKFANPQSGKEIPVKVAMPKITSYQPNQSVKVDGVRISFDFINTGVPHAVVRITDHKNVNEIIGNVDKYVQIVNSVRELNMFKKYGTNVTFYSVHGRGKLHSLTFERGVSGFTQACGTGVVAAVTSYLKNKSGKARVQVPGGIMNVELGDERPVLLGPAKLVAEIQLPT